MSQQPEITFLTVSYNSAPYMALAAQLVKGLNPDTPYTWLVAENSPPNAPYRIAADSPLYDAVLSGPPQRPDPDLPGKGSYHHGDGLNMLLEQVKTRFVLVYDPDFYVVRPNWIRDVLAHMKRHQLAFFGAPYPPRNVTKYRYFPCGHFLLIDLDRAPKETLDFTPTLAERWAQREQDVIDTPKRLAALPWLTKAMTHWMYKGLDETHPVGLKKRANKVGNSGDTGYRIYERYRDSAKAECIVPSCNPELELKTDLLAFGVLTALRPRWKKKLQKNPHWRYVNAVLSEFWLPEDLRYLPSKPGYYSRRRFGESDAMPSVAAKAWDEFFWKRDPFGFHVRNFHHRLSELESREDAEAIRHQSMLDNCDWIAQNVIAPILGQPVDRAYARQHAPESVA